MKDIPPSRSRLLALFAMLYAIQGVVVAYLTNFNKEYMIAAGVPELTAGWVETAALSLLIFKFVLGPVSDKISPFGLGHRKPYIVLGLVLLAGGLLGLTLCHPGRHLALFASMAILAVAGMCLFDTTCDGMVIDVTPPEDRSKVQGTLQLSRFLATMVCTLFFGYWIKRSGPGPGRSDLVIVACAVLALFPLALALSIREPRRADDAPAFDWSAMWALTRKRSLVLLAFGALYGLVGVGVEFNLNRWYDELGYQADGTGVFSSIRYAGRAVGAILLPIAGRKMTTDQKLRMGILLLAASTAGQALVWSDGGAGFWAFTFGMANGWNDALFCVLAMGASDPAMAASTFAIFMAVSNVSIVGNALFLEMVRAVGGFPAAFLIGSVLVMFLLVFVPTLGRDEPEVG